MEYLEQLYQWISSKDNTFTDRYTIDDFKTNMNETDYATKMYDWISSKDDNFTSKYAVDTFIEKVKKKTIPTHLLFLQREIRSLHQLPKQKMFHWYLVRHQGSLVL